jgi:hypothetical protein
LGTAEEGDAKPPENWYHLKLALIESKKVTLRIAGSGSTLLITTPDIVDLSSSVPSKISPEPKKIYPPEPKSPAFQHMIDNEQREYYWAHLLAYQKIVASLERLLKNPLDPLYRKWFDAAPITKDGEARRKTVIANLARMANWMADYTVGFDKTTQNCTFDIGAWTYNSLAMPGTIYLCDNAFNDFFLAYLGALQGNEWTRAFLVIHEVSHAAGQTNDEHYSWLICENLSLFAPQKAVCNAQSYALLP